MLYLARRPYRFGTMPDDPLHLAAALGPNLEAARLCIDVAEQELAIAKAGGRKGRLSTVPPARLRDFETATLGFEHSLTRLLTHMAPQAAQSLPAATQLQRETRCDASSGQSR